MNGELMGEIMQWDSRQFSAAADLMAVVAEGVTGGNLDQETVAGALYAMADYLHQLARDAMCHAEMLTTDYDLVERDAG